MFRFTSILAALIAVVTILITAYSAPAYAAGMSVDPTAGSTDTTFSVQADGFNKNENVATWVQAPNGTTIDLGEIKADSAGSVAFDVTPDSSWKAGEAIAVAHGLSSGHEYSVKFTVSAGGSSDDDSSDTDTSSGSYIANDSDRTLTFYGSGYTAGERVAAWFQYPSELSTSTAHALPDVTADASGNVSFSFTVGAAYPFGGYNIAAQGASSKHTTYNTFSYFGTITDQYTYWAYGTGTSSGSITAAVWQGQYWNNMYLSGDPVLVRQDAAINFNWNGSSPGANVPADQFSARWDTVATVSDAGNYVFTATADDGIRVWVDGTLIIDQWAEHSAATYTATTYLNAGNHSVHVEYFQNYGDAVAIVNIAAQ